MALLLFADVPKDILLLSESWRTTVKILVVGISTNVLGRDPNKFNYNGQTGFHFTHF